MKKEDVYVGMKVVPFQKTKGEQGLGNSQVWKVAKGDKQPYLYVLYKANNYFSLGLTKNDSSGGDHFDAEDFNPYIEEENNIKNWLEKFRNNEFAIHCETGEQAIKLMKILHENNIKWLNGDDAVNHTYYYADKENICYEIKRNNRVNFNNVNTCQNKIIKFSELNKQNSKGTNIKLIQNDATTVVILPDGRKGISKCLPTDEYDEYKGFLLAYCRAVYGKQVTYDNLYGGLKNYHNEELLTEVEKRMK